MGVNSCLCCGNRLLRHAGRKGVYWFCTSCHQEMISPMPRQSTAGLDTLKFRSPLLGNSPKHYSVKY
ncbi:MULTISPECIES: hypothetical protein [unclassified Coleofasciculus]|uniref:hypothetical protein n=1 Tax=unclassified Coleofasciculus TaxID=2692782 RepID=UPI001882FBC7|nr:MULTISPECIES: hypothetical protein [unclassified Coleofasciculus]MBE9126388.1 hypothetical protein [Coleofasciculus sp. LEGE 07081]MBE9149833.1 hypothetical protein [Coleofasciculus sp. LEGE 07092]